MGERPVELVCHMLAAIPGLSHELGHSVVAVDAVHTVGAVFGSLIGHGGSLALEHASEVAWRTALLRYEFPDATEDLRRVLASPAEDGHAEALEWLGIERTCDFDPADFSVERANAAIAGVLIARPA